ncbi:MAG: hypothetical protein MUF87_08720 [Anaerolineae bacterium]|nr:hypothetical protein [Anaerolineae bacterium]
MAKKPIQTGTNNEEMINLANRAIQDGNPDGARVMLRQVLQRDQRNERALLLMARIAKNPREQESFLKRVLKLNPENEAAQKMLKKLEYRSQASQNRTLLFFGVVIAVMTIVAIAVFLLAVGLR